MTLTVHYTGSVHRRYTHNKFNHHQNNNRASHITTFHSQTPTRTRRRIRRPTFAHHNSLQNRQPIIPPSLCQGDAAAAPSGPVDARPPRLRGLSHHELHRPTRRPGSHQCVGDRPRSGRVGGPSALPAGEVPWLVHRL